MNKVWWKEVVAYQIYPRSFMDSNGDGIGDLQGMISRLDYVKDLGIDVIWICPMYKSPNDDNGYDISDYQDIMDEFGTMEDFNQLLEEVHRRGMKLIIDLVVNHTSDEHPWFVESRSSKDNPKRDWYIWRDAKPTNALKSTNDPNNWESIFGGSAWEFDEATGQYYMHLFSRKQPDLNWENTEVRGAIYDMINWWLGRGIDGFRVDAITHIKKEPGLKDMPNPKGLTHVPAYPKIMNIPGIMDMISDIDKHTFSNYPIMTVGEASGVYAHNSHEWVGDELGKFDMIFQFEFKTLWTQDLDLTLDVKGYKRILSKWQKALETKGWIALFIENHDMTRVVSSWGNDKEYRRESATAFGAMYFLMRGTPFIYQGQEIGMTNVQYPNIEDYNCVATKNMYNNRRDQGMSHEEIMPYVWTNCRDSSRTPMQWDATHNAGFSAGNPWLGMNANYTEINVAQQTNDPNSILNFYKKLIALRKSNALFSYGIYDLILKSHAQIYAYTRTLDNQVAVIISNLSATEAAYRYPKLKLSSEHLVLNNYDVEPHQNVSTIRLKPYETRVYLMNM